MIREIHCKCVPMVPQFLWFADGDRIPEEENNCGAVVDDDGL